MKSAVTVSPETHRGSYTDRLPKRNRQLGRSHLVSVGHLGPVQGCKASTAAAAAVTQQTRSNNMYGDSRFALIVTAPSLGHSQAEKSHKLSQFANGQGETDISNSKIIWRQVTVI
jgi:hypothetical protein